MDPYSFHLPLESPPPTEQQPTEESSKMAVLRQGVLELSQLSDTLMSQNRYLVQRITELDRAGITACECPKHRAELAEKNRQLNYSQAQLAGLTKILEEQRVVSAMTCLRCNMRERCVISLPCKHLGLCVACVPFAGNCFVCGRVHTATMEISLKR